MKCADCKNYQKTDPFNTGKPYCRFHQGILEEDALIDEEAERNCVGFERKA